MAKDKPKDDGDDIPVVLNVNINGTIMPVRSIHTIKEMSDYNYDQNKTEHFILINEQNDGTMTVYSNIKIKCISELHMEVVLQNLQEQMKTHNHQFVKV